MEQHYSKLHERGEKIKVIAQKAIIDTINQRIVQTARAFNKCKTREMSDHYASVYDMLIDERVKIENLFKSETENVNT